MKKKLFFLCMVLSICIPCFAQTTFSATNPDGVSINYEITSDSTVAVSGGGCDNDGNLVIPDSVLCNESWYIVKTINDKAFLNNSNLVSIEIPNLVTAIGKEAFSNCKNLVNLSIGDSLKTIGDDAFKDCKNFSNIYVHNSDLFFYISCGEGQSNPFDYAEHLFVNNNEISELIIPNGITALSQRFFKKLGSNITSVTIPNSVKSIGTWAFNGWAKLEHITLGDSIKYFMDDAFFGFVSLETVNVSNIEVLFNDYFFGRNANPFLIAKEICVNSIPITELEVPNTVKEIKSGVFSGRNITALTLSESVEKIGDNAFANCTNLASVDLGLSVDTISTCAFAGCSSIESIAIPNSVKVIDDRAFEGCTKLSSITLGDSVTFIGSNAFNGCDSLQRVDVTNLDAWYAIQFEDEKANPLTLAQHLYHNGEEITGLHIPDGIAEINEGFFSRFANVTSVVLPNSVKRIGDRAFQNLTNLQSVILNDSLETIGEQAFEKCTSLESITIPNSVKSIAQKAFSDCINISTVTLGDSLRVISKSSFSGCTLLDSITIPNSVVTIEERAFENCTNLSYISLGDSLKAIKHYAFKNCDSLIVNIPNINFLFGACVYDEYYSNPFVKAKELLLNKELVTELTIPNGVTEINRGFLYNLGRQINSVTMPNSVKIIKQYAFKECKNLKHITLSDSLHTIEPDAFWSCGIDSIIFPNSLISIGDGAFKGCSKLSYITLGDSIKTIGENVFKDCESLKTVNIYHLETMLNIQCGNNNSNPFSIASTLHLNGEEVTELVIPEGITEIKSGFLYNFGKNVTSITMPNSLVTVKDYTFQDWSKLEHLTLGDSIRNFGYAAFHGCDSLTIKVAKLETLFNDFSFGGNNSNPFEKAVQLCLNDQPITELDVPNTVKEIKGGVFNGKNITTLKVSNSVEQIGDKAFSNCKDLISVDLGQSVDTIFAEAFRYCSSIESIVIPNSVKAIGYRAFEGCTKLSSITLGDSVTFIGSNAFNGCDSLQRVEVTNMDTWYAIQFENEKANPLTLAQHLYHNGEEVTGLHIPDGIAEINEGFFKGYENITSVVLPNSVKRIGDRAFRNLTNLKYVTLGDSLTTIGSSAFENCQSLSYISFGDSIRNFGNAAFSRCDSLTINVSKLETLFNDFSFGGNNSNPFEKAIQLCLNDQPITELDVPNTVKEIKGGLFNGRNITALKVSDSVEKIGDNAFSNCKDLISVDLGQSVDTIFAEAFRYCSSIESIVIPNSVKVIDDRAFEGCTKLSSITLGDSVTFIGRDAFNGCDSLQRVEVTNLDAWYAIQFENDKANPLTLAQHLYHNGEEVTGFHIPDGIAEINEGFFKGYENITSVVLPNSVRRIGYRAFKNLTNLKSVILGDSLKTIGREAFQGCTALESIIIPNSVTTIDGGVFEGCTKLSSITLGDSVKSIGHYAFNGCDKLSKVNVTNMANFCNIEFARHNSNGGNSNPLLIAKHLYLNDEKVTDLVIPNEVERIANYVFAGSDIISVSIPNSVHVIGDYAFRDCSSLTSVVIGDSVTTIGADAFWGCHELSYISLGESLDSIANSAFFACDSLIVNVTKIETLFKDYKFGSWSSNPFSCSIELCLNDEPIVELEVPNTVAKIRGDIFKGSKIESVIIPSSVKTIDAEAFDNCEELYFVTLGDSLESIGEAAFANCSALTSIDIPNSVKSIATRAFENCSDMESVTLGNSLESIGEAAFRDCKALTSVEIPNSVISIGNYAFQSCQVLTTINIPNTITSIGTAVFEYCRSLTSIDIPNSVTSIGAGAFYDCYGLASVTMPNSIQTIGERAFGNIGNSLSNGQQTAVYIPSVDWLFKVKINSNGNDHLLRNLYIGQKPLTSLEIPDNLKDVSVLPLLYRSNRNITALNTGDGLRTLPEGRSEYITQVTLGSSITKVESEFPNALIVVSNVSKAPTITENTFPKCMWDNGGDGVVVLLSPSDQNTYSKAKIWENMQLTNQSNQVEVNVATPGELDWEILQKSGIPAAKVVGLTVSGEINDKDFVQMKSNMKSLLYLDLTNAKITNIPNNALDSKQQLLSLALPNTVKTIGAYAFRGCSGIKELELPTDLEEIGEEAFTGINIETLDFNYALKKIGNRAFANTPLKEISFQNKVEVIGNEAFKGCNLQQELTFSDALISIGERAFEGHRGITGHLTIPDGVTSVGQSAFAGTSIYTVFISGKMTTLESSVFADCDLLDAVYIPDNITRINSSAFQGCESLKNLRLSQNLEVIEREAFRSIPIKSVNIPENVEKIDGYAFADCANLRFVTLPANIKSLDEGVFSGCRQLMNLTVKNITPPTVKANTFRGVNIDKCIISIPTVAYKPYVLAEYWGRFVQMRNDIAVQMKGNGSISFASGDTMEDEEEASSRMMMATRAGEETEGTVTTVEDGSSLYVPQNGLVRFYITPASGEEIVSATFDGVDITAQIVDGIYETTADKDSANLVVSFSEKTKTAQTITWEQEFEPMMVGDKVTLNATASSGLVVTYEFADGESSERAELSDGIITILKSGNIALVAKQSGNEEYASATTDVKYIKAYAYGDANGNMEINSADLAVTVDYAIGNEPQEFFFRAADVNKDKNVNVADVSGVVDIVLSAPAATDNASGNAREFDTSDNMVSILEGNSLNFYFTNKEEGFLTFQCDIRMAEGSMPELDITGNPIVAIRNKKGTGNHIAVARLLEDGCIRILVYSTDNTPIPSNYSFALSLENEPNESDIEILNAGYSYRDSEQIAYGRLNCGVVTGLDSVTGDADQMEIKVNGNTISFYSATDCLMPIVSVNGISYMLNVKAGFNEFTVNSGVYVIGKNKVIIK